MLLFMICFYVIDQKGCSSSLAGITFVAVLANCFILCILSPGEVLPNEGLPPCHGAPESGGRRVGAELVGGLVRLLAGQELTVLER